MENDELKSGYTTGSCAAAATKVALEKLINNEILDEVEIISLNNTRLIIPVERILAKKNSCIVVIKKDAGDDPDVTHGKNICVRVKLVDELPKNSKAQYYDNFMILGGKGVGLVTKKGLQIQVGKYAINPGPLKMISTVVESFLDKTNKKIIVTIFVPEGKKIALQTYNPKMGVIGGISILGTTGIVKPMSEEALKRSMYAELKVIKENNGKDYVIFAFGNYGKEHCKKINLNEEQLIIISNFVGFMIESSVKLGFKKIIMLGHISKAIKIAGGIFNTHSRVADARMEIMAINAYIIGESDEVIKKILNSNTIEEACNYVTKNELYTLISNKVAYKMQEYSRADIEVSTAIFSFKGETIGESDNYQKMIKECSLVGRKIDE